jgi:preprotein translocase subunit YajC
MENIWILAESESGQPTMIESEQSQGQEYETISVPSDANEAAKPTGRRGLFGNQGGLIFIIIMVAVMYFFLLRGPRKKQQEHKQMVQSLKKNDKVRTIGGIIGTIVDIKDDEITLKIDETNNTKIKVIPSAIGRNLSQEKN